jgi:hypothetical protein
MLDIDFKILFAIVATTIALISYIPYVKSMYWGTAQPHPYTWLVWTITQSIAAAGVWSSANAWVAVSMGIVSCCVFLIFLFSLHRGSRNITCADTVCLTAAAGTVLVWIATDNILAAVLLATAIDWFGYLPTVRKTWVTPKTEPKIVWFGFVIATFLSICALETYSLQSTAYLAMSLLMNIIVLGVSFRKV